MHDASFSLLIYRLNIHHIKGKDSTGNTALKVPRNKPQSILSVGQAFLRCPALAWK